MTMRAGFFCLASAVASGLSASAVVEDAAFVLPGGRGTVGLELGTTAVLFGPKRRPKNPGFFCESSLGVGVFCSTAPVGFLNRFARFFGCRG